VTGPAVLIVTGVLNVGNAGLHWAELLDSAAARMLAIKRGLGGALRTGRRSALLSSGAPPWPLNARFAGRVGGVGAPQLGGRPSCGALLEIDAELTNVKEAAPAGEAVVA